MGEDDEAICQTCSKRKATVHLARFADGQWVPVHLCEECYAKSEGEPEQASSKLFAQMLSAIAPDLQRMGDKQCPRCGMSYLEFREGLRLGCQKGYEEFSEALDGLLERIHGANRHVGKIPLGRAQKRTRHIRLEALRNELERVVKAEDFQRAAQVRDLMKELEQESARGDEA